MHTSRVVSSLCSQVQTRQPHRSKQGWDQSLTRSRVPWLCRRSWSLTTNRLTWFDSPGPTLGCLRRLISTGRVLAVGATSRRAGWSAERAWGTALWHRVDPPAHSTGAVRACGIGGSPLSPRTGQPRSMGSNPRHPAPFLSGHTALTVSTAGSRLLPHDPQERSVRPSRGPPPNCPPQSSPRALPSAYLSPTAPASLPHPDAHPLPGSPSEPWEGRPPEALCSRRTGVPGWGRVEKVSQVHILAAAPTGSYRSSRPPSPLSCRQTSGRRRLGGRVGRPRGQLASGRWARCAGPRSRPGTTNLLTLQGPTQVSPSLGRLPGSRVDRSDLSLLRT